MSVPAPISATILTGFLGAGKTTLLRRILADPRGVRFGVLVNDFGAVDIDADLVAARTEDSVALRNGCVCCTIRDDMIAALTALVDRDPPPERIVIEASGVSRPLPIADALADDALASRVRLDGIFCLVDGDAFGTLDFAATELAIEQAAGSDVVLLNKADLADEATLAAVERTLAGPIPRLRLLRTVEADVPRDFLFGEERRSQRNGVPSHHRDHDHDFAAWHWSSPDPLDPGRLRAAMRRLPPGVLRAKGILRAKDGGRLVLQAVGKRVAVDHEPGAPAPSRSDVVAIGRPGAMGEDGLAALLDPCRA